MKLHIKYLEFLQKRFMTYSLLSENLATVNGVQSERATQLEHSGFFMEGAAVSSPVTCVSGGIAVQSCHTA